MAEFRSGDSNVDPAPGGPGNGSASRNGNASGGGGGHQGHSSSHSSDAGSDGLIHILSRQWYVVVLCTIAVLMLAVLYLLVTKPVYTSVSTLQVKPLDAQEIASNSSNSENAALADSDFLDTECVVIKSNAVLALAMDKIRNTRTLAGVSHPMEYVKNHLTADQAKKGEAIEVSFDSRYPDEANLIVDSVVEAYKEYESESWKSRANDVLETLKNGSQGQEQELLARELRMREIERQTGFVPDVDPSKSPQHQDVVALREAKEKAQLEVMRSHNAYEQSFKAIIGDEAKLKGVDEAEEHATYSSTKPEEQLEKFQSELAIEQAKLADDSRNYLPSHPVIMTDQARVDQMIIATVVAAKDWEESTQAQWELIDKSLAAAEKTELAAAESQREYIQLQMEVDHLKKGSDDVDNRIAQIDLTKGAGALNIRVLNEAEVTADPKPLKPRTLAIGLVLGMIIGLGTACVRDWTDDRMRTPQAVRLATGTSVLGAIPAITTAYTAADRGQIVHYDPFGDAAESYRTLRTALQFGLAPGTKTLLITSPVSGDGKSTFVSNLGIAMAQASRRVLIIDADLRAPMQHRIFGLRDRVGLATVLGGSDTLAEAIQRTEIEGLDVLPCGPAPTNPAEMLNSQAFADRVNELADKYDLVILDSPPVTAVADARILAASTDASLLVLRLETSTRKHAEAARDGLRSVGARLIGVAVNGVSRGGHFGGASGYYPQADFQPASRAARQPTFADPEKRIDPAARA